MIYIWSYKWQTWSNEKVGRDVDHKYSVD